MTDTVRAGPVTRDRNAIKNAHPANVLKRVQVNVNYAITPQANAPNASTATPMEPNANTNVVLAVLTRHVTLHLDSVMRVMMVILGHFVIPRAVIPASTINVTEMATARPDVLTATMVHSASSNALITARPPHTAATVTTKDIVCMDVLTDLQVTTVTQVREC